jgi:hypothetical protein
LYFKFPIAAVILAERVLGISGRKIHLKDDLLAAGVGGWKRGHLNMISYDCRDCLEIGSRGMRLVVKTWEHDL